MVKRLPKVRDGYDPSISIEISGECAACGACVEVCPWARSRLTWEDPSPGGWWLLPLRSAFVAASASRSARMMRFPTATSHSRSLAALIQVPGLEWDDFIALTRQRRSVRCFSTTPVPGGDHRQNIERVHAVRSNGREPAGGGNSLSRGRSPAGNSGGDERVNITTPQAAKIHASGSQAN